MEFVINVVDKIAMVIDAPVIICGNSDYVVNFVFDSEWDKYVEKTARFKFTKNGKKEFIDVLFSGTRCDVPILSDIETVEIGVYSGNLSTTTGTIVECKKSILCGDGVHTLPPEDVYNQLLEKTITDQTYSATSENAQSGKAVAQAVIDKATVHKGTWISSLSQREEADYNGIFEFVESKTDSNIFDEKIDIFTEDTYEFKVGDFYYNTEEERLFLCLSVNIEYGSNNSSTAYTTWKDINFNSMNQIIETVTETDKNLINPNSWVNGAIVDGGNNGNLKYRDAYIDTFYAHEDYIEVSDDTEYYWLSDRNKPAGIYSGHYAFYDENKVFISGTGTSSSTSGNGLSNPFTPPKGAKYLRVTILAAQLKNGAWISKKPTEPTGETTITTYLKSDVKDDINCSNPCDYKGDEIRVFNKIMCIGDSLTAGTFNHTESGTNEYKTYAKYSYPTYLSKITGIEVVNNGIGGMDSVQWFNYYENEDFSGYDCAIINLGVNDFYHSVATSDTKTALNNIITKLKTENIGIKIFIATIIPAYADLNTNFDNINTIIKEVAQENADCYLVDLTQHSYAKSNSVYEAGHLTALGYLQLAKDYKAYISNIIVKNGYDFYNVQFIGTEHSYSYLPIK